MSEYFRVHQQNPQRRLLASAATILLNGGIIAYPTDSTYALACHLGEKKALQRIRQIRQLDEKHMLTLLCRDLSELATYAQVNNSVYRFLKSYTPGPYTFILEATREVPRRLLHPKRKTLGLRVPGNLIAQVLLEEVGEPLMTTTLQLAGDEYPLMDPEDIKHQLANQLDAIIDGGYCGLEETTVIDLQETPPAVIRQGIGEIL